MKKLLISLIILGSINQYSIAQCPTNAGSDKTVCSDIWNGGRAVTIGPSYANPYLTYSWSPTTGLSNPNIANPSALPGETTTYTLTVSGGGCGTHNYSTTVRVAGLMYVKNPDGSKERMRAGYEIYYPYEGSYTLQLSTDDPNAEWWDMNSGLLTTGSTYNFNFTGLGNNTRQLYLNSVDANSISCISIDQPQITTYGVYSNGYPVSVNHVYYASSSCGPTLPATISQVSNLGGYPCSYGWTLKGTNASNWSVTSPSGNSATLNRSGGTPPAEVDIYARAYTGTLGPTDAPDYEDMWMIYGVSYHSGSYPGCYPMTKKVVDENNKLLVNDAATKLFPNPARSFVTVSGRYVINAIEMYNAAGLLVRSVRGNGKAMININTIGLAKGVYLLKVNGEKGVESLKAVVE